MTSSKHRNPEADLHNAAKKKQTQSRSKLLDLNALVILGNGLISFRVQWEILIYCVVSAKTDGAGRRVNFNENESHPRAAMFKRKMRRCSE